MQLWKKPDRASSGWRRTAGRHRAPRLVISGVAAVAALGGLTALAGVAGLVGLPGLAGAATTGTSATALPLDGAGSTMTLVTGDQVGVTAGASGRPAFALRPGTSRGGQSFQDASGDTYLVPGLAQPYLGRQLDPSLFDVSALARDGLASSARVPVALAFAAGTAPSAPPGVTLTSMNGTSASGYLTAGSAGSFGAALKHAIAADVVAGRRPGSTPPVAGLTRIALAAAGAPTVVKPHYPLHTLELDEVDGTSAAGELAVFLMNTDALHRQVGLVPVAGGVARVQVPAGHYVANATQLDFDAQGNQTASRMVAVDDITVPDTAGTVTTAAVDVRAATSVVSVTGTPHPATQDNLVVSYYRFDAAGEGDHLYTYSFDQVPAYVNAQPAPQAGRLHYVVQWGGAAPHPTDGYRYDVAFASDTGVAADQSYRVRAGQLATVHHHLYADPGRTGTTTGWLSGATDDQVMPQWGFSYQIGVSTGPTVPGDLTQYAGTADGGQWSNGYGNLWISLSGDPRTFAAGHEYGIDWGRGPLAPGLGRYTGLRPCFACVAGGTVTLGLPEFHDSEPDHTSGAGAAVPAHVTLYRDGEQVADEDDAGLVVQGLPAGPATLREVSDVQQNGPDYKQSLRTHTEVTVREPGATGVTLPAADSCAGGTADSPCLVLPVPTLTYQLAADSTNTSALATQTMGLDVGHVSYDGAGSRSRTTAATVSVSFDDGTSWTAAALTGNAGHYLARWTNPASARGTSPTLKVTATDADGNAITQTITAAYTIAAAS